MNSDLLQAWFLIRSHMERWACINSFGASLTWVKSANFSWVVFCSKVWRRFFGLFRCLYGVVFFFFSVFCRFRIYSGVLLLCLRFTLLSKFKVIVTWSCRRLRDWSATKVVARYIIFKESSLCPFLQPGRLLSTPLPLKVSLPPWLPPWRIIEDFGLVFCRAGLAGERTGIKSKVCQRFQGEKVE